MFFLVFSNEGIFDVVKEKAVWKKSINSRRDFINSRRDFINPRRDFINPRRDFINSRRDFNFTPALATLPLGTTNAFPRHYEYLPSALSRRYSLAGEPFPRVTGGQT